MESISEFIDSYFLWRVPILIGVVSATVCGFLGVYVVLRRVIFVSAALTQISSFGVALAFYYQGVFLGFLSSLLDPFTLSLIITSVAALFFAWEIDYFRISQEGIIGFVFLIASGAVVIIGDKITKGAHDIANILFGSAVVVDPRDVYLIPSIVVIVLIIHIYLYKDLIFVSFDNETAKLFNYPILLLNSILFLTIGLVVSITTRALGALPVFALLVLPPLTAILVSERLKSIFIISATVGMISAAIGYFFSFILSIPTGASMVVCASSFFVFALFWRKAQNLLKIWF